MRLPISSYTAGSVGVKLASPSTYLLNIEKHEAIKTVSCISLSLAPRALAAAISAGFTLAAYLYFACYMKQGFHFITYMGTEHISQYFIYYISLLHTNI
jgi:hypothetical protein